MKQEVRYVIQVRERGGWKDLIDWLTPRTQEQIETIRQDRRFGLWPMAELHQIKRTIIEEVI